MKKLMNLVLRVNLTYHKHLNVFLGFEKGVLLCSKIEVDDKKDKKDLAMIITFKDDRGKIFLFPQRFYIPFYETFDWLHVCSYIMILESRDCKVPIPKTNIHQQSAVMFGKDYIEKLRSGNAKKNEKYSIFDQINQME